jgi:hypothetical protein
MAAVRETFDLTPRGIDGAGSPQADLFGNVGLRHFGRTPETIKNGRGSVTLFTWSAPTRGGAQEGCQVTTAVPQQYHRPTSPRAPTGIFALGKLEFTLGRIA